MSYEKDETGKKKETPAPATGASEAETVNARAEEAYWRERYERESYYEAGRTYEDYGPAYTLGWTSVALYGTEFEAVEPELERQWERQRGQSGLTWSHAREATRAAWDRVKKGVGAAVAPMRNDDVVDILNDLVETCHDGEYGFKTCLERTKAPQLISVFQERMRAYANMAAELSSEVVRLGGTPEGGGTVSGAAHRGWVTVRSMLAGDSDLAILEECERGEDMALARYRKALKQALPVDIQAMVERQMGAIQQNHDRIKALRDEEKPRR